jgi:hypothetical protein
LNFTDNRKSFSFLRVQQTNNSLNIITGFHLFDDEQHLFILEGRKEDAIDILYKEVPKPKGQSTTMVSYSSPNLTTFFCYLDIEILYDSSVHFNQRLYVKFGIDLTHFKLSRTLRDIVSQPFIFVRDSLPKDTFAALDKLHQVCLSFLK